MTTPTWTTIRLSDALEFTKLIDKLRPALVTFERSVPPAAGSLRCQFLSENGGGLNTGPVRIVLTATGTESQMTDLAAELRSTCSTLGLMDAKGSISVPGVELPALS